MRQDDGFPLGSLLKAIAFSLNQFRLYSESHPIVKDSLARLDQERMKAFETRSKITIGRMGENLVVDGQPVTQKDPAFQDFSKTLGRMNLEGLTLEKGITAEEFADFVKMLGMRPKDLETKGGFKKVFDEKHFQYIRMTSGKFQLVEEGQEVRDSKEGSSGGEGQDGEGSGGGAAEAVKKPASIFEVIQQIRQSHVNDGQALPVLELDCEKVVYQIEKQPEMAAEAVAAKIQDPAEVETVVRGIVRQITEGLLSFLAENAKDLTKALEKFSKEIEKAVRKTLGDEKAGGIREKITGVFQEAIDHHRIQMVLKTWEKHPEDPKPVQKIIQKLFQKEDVRERLLPQLEKDLGRVGYPSEHLEAVLESLDEKVAKKKTRVTVDAAELAELRRKAKLFDQGGRGGGSGGGGEAAQAEIAQLKAEKKKVLDEKERVDAVIRNLAEGLVVVDPHGKVVMMNPAAENLLGVRQQDKQGQDLKSGLKEEHLVALTQGHLRDEGAVAKQVALESLSEETKRILQASTAVIENEDGQTVGMVAVLSDVTRQKEVEKIKSQFVANVSHELRTPLVAIQKSLGLIIGREVGDVTPEQEKFLTMAHRNIERLSRLINDLLDVAKLEAGKMTLQPKIIPLTSLVQMVTSTMETWFKDKHIHVETRFSHASVEIEGDADRLTQVMTNLIGNAVKYTPDGGVITIEIQDPAPNKRITSPDAVEISIRDTGIGITPEDQKKIFDKFVQVSLAQPAGVSSTGLGLTIVKEIIELHSGGIFLESEVGKGSRFYFQLPKKFTLREEAKSRF